MKTTPKTKSVAKATPRATKKAETAKKSAKPTSKPGKTASKTPKLPTKTEKPVKKKAKSPKIDLKSATAKELAPILNKTSPAKLAALTKKIAAILDSKKAENIQILDLSSLSSVADYMILCTGLNAPHLRALADEVVTQLRQETPPVLCHRRAGNVESEWIVLDYVEIVVHCFTPSTRSYYALEQLWKDAPKLT